MTLPADGHFSKLFFQGVEDGAILQISFSSPVQNDGPRFHILLTILDKKTSSSAWTHAKNSEEMDFLSVLDSTVRL